MSDIKLGTIITGNAQRDAIHIAIAPVTSDERLCPGDHVSIVRDSPDKVQSLRGAENEIGIGIVDPFLPLAVEPGQKFWLCLYPQTITSLRHDWTHPAFPSIALAESERYLRDVAAGLGVNYEDVLYAGTAQDYPGAFGTEIDGDREIKPEFWEHIQRVTGRATPADKRPAYFRCAC